MKKIIKILLSSLLIALFAFTASGHLNGDIPVYAAKASVAYPKSSLKSGIYYLKEITKIKLTTTTEGADIYYCINDGKYQLYSKPIALTQNTQIKTYAVKDGVKSKVILYNYRFKPKFKVSHKSGTYTSAQVSSITTPLTETSLLNFQRLILHRELSSTKAVRFVFLQRKKTGEKFTFHLILK